ncbi:MAG: 1-aminocyclopropane-1-carboxylate deaminase [Flavobacteriaceae bacterium]|nr:1-aminocyclopropane-1-carboxylate deaminase [Flavobacteriaceae bacterium]|tara:strand:- start:9360 stop:10298 length:939 start_codon:yes stop_codon:yes gene_type:complete
MKRDILTIAIPQIPVEPVTTELLSEKNIVLDVLREDLIHPEVSGNKFRKLKYNVEQALRKEASGLLTFGGAYSNHIAATAAMGKITGLSTVGMIRGEELQYSFMENPTLRYAHEQGMHLEFMSRNAYREKERPQTIELLREKWGNIHILPEGGSNALAVKGCAEILGEAMSEYTHIAVSVGTGGTMAGLVASALPHQEVIGFSALRGTFQKKLIQKYTQNKRFHITDDYCFGGYAKVTPPLIAFMNAFREQNNILLDPVYTGKMLWGIFDWVKGEKFLKNSRILAIHTGGLQGIVGMNQYLKRKNQPLINTY